LAVKLIDLLLTIDLPSQTGIGAGLLWRRKTGQSLQG